MKFMATVLFSIIAFSVSAGEIVNRRTGDSLEIIINETEKSLVIEATIEGNTEVKIVKLMDYFKTKEHYLTKKGNLAILEAPFANSRNIVNNVETKYLPGFVYLFLPLTAVVDIAGLPLTVPVGIFQSTSNINIRKDIKILREAITTDGIQEVSNRRFNLLLDYIELL